MTKNAIAHIIAYTVLVSFLLALTNVSLYLNPEELTTWNRLSIADILFFVGFSALYHVHLDAKWNDGKCKEHNEGWLYNGVDQTRTVSVVCGKGCQAKFPDIYLSGKPQ